IGTLSAAKSTAARACVPRPVVPITSAAPAAVAATVTASVALAEVKSIQTSAAPLAGIAASMITPAASIPARKPASAPMALAPARSGAAVRTAPGPAALTARVSARPMRPSAPRTAIRTGFASDIARLEEPELLQLRLELVAILRRQRIEGRPDLLGDSPHHGHRRLDRDRVGLDEQPFAERQQAVVQLARLVPVAGRGGVPHAAHQ